MHRRRAEPRHFENAWPGFPDPSDPSEAAKQSVSTIMHAEPETRANLHTRISRILRNIVRDDPPAPQPRRTDVYIGHGGYALLFLQAYRASRRGADIAGFESKQLLYIAENYIDGCLTALPTASASAASTFLTGAAGVHAVAAAIYAEAGRRNELEAMLSALLQVGEPCTTNPTQQSALQEMPDELLYGRAGYLYSLLWIYARRNTLHCALPPSFLPTMRRVFDAVIESGIARAAANAETDLPFELPPLVWAFHGKLYLGAGHGFAGILLVLMQALQVTDHFGHSVPEKHLSLIWNTVDAVRAQRLTHGDFPAVLGQTTAELVQWCHGAPGILLLLARAKAMNPSLSVVELMTSAAAVWQRGLLTKGHGLCHGTAGNGYAFLALHHVTRQPAFRLAAQAFAMHILDDSKANMYRPADRPLSLFEGQAGTAYFLLSMLDTESATFPGAEI